MRCLVIEDEQETARYICHGLRLAGHEAVSCDNAVEGESLALSGDWDVIVLDRLLPGSRDGLGVLDSLRRAGRQLPVLVLSALGSTDERVHGLRAGADDYLTKPFALEELLARLDVLVRRQHPRRVASQLQVADLQLDLRSQRVTRAGQVIVLQPREFRLLEYLMRHEDQVVTRAMLLESVWEYHFDPQTNVIDVQISRLRNKIDRDFDQPLIHTVRGAGYRLSALASPEPMSLEPADGET